MVIKEEEDKNSISSDKEEVDVRDKEDDEVKEINKRGEDEDDDNEDDDEDDDEEDDEEEEEEDEEDEDDEEEDEYDHNVIQFELFKNFLVDDEGNNVATNLKSIAHELRTLNKIAKLFLKDK